MKSFNAPTEDFVKSEVTEITADVSAGNSVSISVNNTDNFEANDYIIIGREGNDKAEVCKIASTSTPTGITVSVLQFNHKSGEKITKIAFNQRRFYGAESSGGGYVLIETKDIEVDNPAGTYFEYTGSTYSYFKATYYNDISEEATSLDDAIEVYASDTAHYCSVYDIREEAGFLDNPYITEGRINNLRIQAESEVKGTIAASYSLPLSEIPEIVKNVTKLLAAGFLLRQEYGPEAEGTNKEGQTKIDEARKTLKAISKREIVLLDSNDSELSNSTGEQLNGWPNNTTSDADDDDAGGDVHFRISKKF